MWNASVRFVVAFVVANKGCPAAYNLSWTFCCEMVAQLAVQQVKT